MIAGFVATALVSFVSSEICRSQFPIAAPRSGRVYFNTFDPVFEGVALKRNVDPALLKAIAWCETRLDPCAESAAGAKGLMQFIGGTFALVSRASAASNPFDPIDSVESAGVYLATLLNHWQGDMLAVVASYNAGPAAVHRARSHGASVPNIAETKGYVDCVLPAFDKFRTEFRSVTPVQISEPTWRSLITFLFPRKQQ